VTEHRNGGIIQGPSARDSDSILCMLSPGYVISASQLAKLGKPVTANAIQSFAPQRKDDDDQ